MLHKLLDIITGVSPANWSRVVLNEKLNAYASGLASSGATCLEISGDEFSSLPWNEYQSACFPEFDICHQALNETFDVIIANQVFEHLRYPRNAALNVYQMLKPGGIFILSTPFLVKIHLYPTDCTRWTPDGLKYFLHDAGWSLDDIETGSWGNRSCVIANFKKWRRFRRRLHSLKNEEDFPFVVWAYAKKQQQPNP